MRNTVIAVYHLVAIVIRIVRDTYLTRMLEPYYRPSDAYRILRDSLLVITSMQVIFLIMFIILGLHTSLHNNIPTRFRNGYILYIGVRC